ncbi:MAG TPA: hypothetical protein VGF69_03095 [Thermoanaerobaculia bacterium]|jgi:hypothetical protein
MTDQNDQGGGRGVAEFLKEWGFDVSAFESRVKQSLSGARGTIQAGAPAASEIKTGIERAWNEIEEAFKRARQTMKHETPGATATAAAPETSNDQPATPEPPSPS